MSEPLDLETFEREFCFADSSIVWELTRDELALVWHEVFRLRAALEQAELERDQLEDDLVECNGSHDKAMVTVARANQRVEQAEQERDHKAEVAQTWFVRCGQFERERDTAQARVAALEARMHEARELIADGRPFAAVMALGDALAALPPREEA